MLAAAAAYVLTSSGAKEEQGSEFTVEFDNAFGLVKGGDVKVAGRARGQDLHAARRPARAKRALVDFKLTKQGFGDLRADTYCESRPQSLIGEYFIDCTPGKSPEKLKPGAKIPVERTASTIPADLLANIMRRPYRERLRIILNELGAGVGGRAEDVNATDPPRQPGAARDRQGAEDPRPPEPGPQGPDHERGHGRRRPRGQPPQRRALRQGDRGRGHHLGRAPPRRSPRASSGCRPSCASCKPTMAELGATADASTPYLRDLNASAGQLERFLENLGPFSESSRVNVRTLAKTADVGRPAIRSARPTVAELTKTTAKAPELANNLEIVLRDLDDRGRAVEKDKRSPGGQGYTGFEAVLSYIFDQTMAINVFDENGHILKINLSRLGVQRVPERGLAQAQGEGEPRLHQALPRRARPQPAGRHDRRPDRHRRRRSRPRAAGAEREALKKKAKRRAARKPEKKSENAPGQPDLKKALERLLGGGGGTNKPPCPRRRCRT